MTSIQKLQGSLLAITTLWKRELVRFFRQKGRVVGALGTPVGFWILIGSGFGKSFRMPISTHANEINYLEYFFPGTITLIILFTSIFSTISLIEDRKEGFLLSVLVAPVSRPTIVIGKILGGTTLAFFQALAFVLLAPLIGIPLNGKQFASMLGVLFLIAFALTALGFAIAWKSESTQGFHAVMNLVLFPMWLLSGALFPITGASSWLGWVMKLNPLTYGVSSLRHILYAGNPAVVDGLLPLSQSILITSFFGIIALVVAFILASRKTNQGFS